MTFIDARRMTTPFDWRVGVDWDGDGYVNWFYNGWDALNEITTLTSISAGARLDELNAVATASASYTLDAGHTPYGSRYWNVTALAAGSFAGVSLLNDGSTFDLAVTNGVEYKFVLWVKGIDFTGGQSVLTRIFEQGDTVAVGGTGSDTTVIDGTWQRIEVYYTATGTSANFSVRVQKNSIASDRTFYITGLMVFTDTTTAPTVYNAGGTTLQYDNVGDDVREMRWFNGIRTPYQDVGDENTALVFLRNIDRKYSPEHENCFLGSSMLPGRRIEIGYTLDKGLTNVLLSATIAKEYVLTSGGDGPNAGAAELQITAESYRSIFADEEVTIENDFTKFASFTADGVIGDVLALFSLPTTGLETGDITFQQYYGDSRTNRAWDSIQAVITDEGGRGFWNREGIFEFWNRTHLDGLSSVATVDQELQLYPAKEPLPYSWGGLLCNSVLVKVHTRQDITSETLWQVDDDILIPAGEIVTINVELKRSNGQDAAAGTLSTSGATWADANTATITVTEGGLRATLTLDNSGGGSDATLTGLTVSGASKLKQNSYDLKVQDAASVAAYGVLNQINLDLSYITKLAVAKTRAEFELNRRSTNRGVIGSLSYLTKGDFGEANRHQYIWTIGDQLTVRAPERGHNSDYIIIGEEHSYRVDRGHTHETKFFLEPAPG